MKDKPKDRSVAHSTRKVEAQEWLWPGRIPQGHLTILGGTTGAGKSLVVADIVARVTTGAEWPDGTGRARKGTALVISEDPVPSMQNPRLLAAGADLDKVRHWRGPFCIEDDLDDLEATLKAHPSIQLIVIDPLQDCMRAISYHGVRAALAGLVERVRKYKVTIIAMGHPPKGLPAPLDSFGGSRGIPSVARAFWFMTKEREDQHHLMLFVKCNVSAPVLSGLGFNVGVKEILDNIGKPVDSPHAVWDDEPVAMSANDWWFTEKGRRGEAEPRRARSIAIAFLQAFLAEGPKLADAVMQEAERRGIGRGTLHTARMELGLVVEKQAGIPHGPSCWSLPEEAQQSQPAQPSDAPKGKRDGSNVIPFPNKKVDGGGGGEVA
jgi:AAA domain